MISEVNKYTEEELLVLKERKRICNLSREDMVREYLDTLTNNEIWAYAYEAILDDQDYDNDDMRHDLVRNL